MRHSSTTDTPTHPQSPSQSHLHGQDKVTVLSLLSKQIRLKFALKGGKRKTVKIHRLRTQNNSKSHNLFSVLIFNLYL